MLSVLLTGPVYAQSGQSIVLTADKTGGTAPLTVNFLADLKNKGFQIAKRQDQEKRGEDIVETKLFNKETLRKMRRKDFINNRAYLTVRDWVAGKKGLFRILR